MYEPIVKATIYLLRELRIKVNDFTVNEALQNHPDWPSILCISDALNKWNIPNATAKIDKNNIDELPVPFLAYNDNTQSPLSLITDVNGATVQLLENDFEKKVTKSKEEFLKQWNGIYLIAEPNEQSGEKDHDIKQKEAFFKSLLPAGLIALVLFIFFYSYFAAKTIAAEYRLAVFFYLIILICGLVVSVALLWYEIDKSNPFLHKFCTVIKKGNCNAILTGKHSKVFSWLSWSEVGFFYFAGALLVMLFSGFANQSLALVTLFNLAALVYPFYSIYYQLQVAKQWCVLCLSVQTLLVLSTVNISFFKLWNTIPEISVAFSMLSFILYLLPVFFWFVLKPYILKLQEAKNTKREFLRIKFNSEIFNALLKKQKRVHISPQGLGITIGNPTATNELIKVCNPYCSPCAKAHPKIEALLEEIPDLKARVIFTTPNKEGHPALKITSHLLAIAAQENESKTKLALVDWYNKEEKSYEIFATKYPMNGELQEQGAKVEAMSKWCTEMRIFYTPTIFINGYQLPEAYNINDLSYFLLDDNFTKGII